MREIKLRHLSRSEIGPGIKASRLATAVREMTEVGVKIEKFHDDVLSVSYGQ